MRQSLIVIRRTEGVSPLVLQRAIPNSHGSSLRQQGLPVQNYDAIVDSAKDFHADILIVRTNRKKPGFGIVVEGLASRASWDSLSAGHEFESTELLMENQGMKKVTKLKRVPRVKGVKRAKGADSLESLRATLGDRSKEELIEVVVELARGSRVIQRELESRYDVKLSVEQLVADTRMAISDATDFDERRLNSNFEYDYGAYETVQRNLRRLIELGQLDHAIELSLELMRDGSYQVEMSDEGLMSEDIAECLRIVIQAVNKSKLSSPVVIAWCDKLRKSDRVGFIADKEIETLRKRFAV